MPTCPRANQILQAESVRSEERSGSLNESSLPRNYYACRFCFARICHGSIHNYGHQSGQLFHRRHTFRPYLGCRPLFIPTSLRDGLFHRCRHTTFVYSASVNTQVTASAGSHILHVKSWGNQGAGCNTDVPISVSSSAAAGLFTDLMVSQPSSGAKLVSPFALTASETKCQSQSIAAMGYSIDDSSNTTIVLGAALNVQAVAPSAPRRSTSSPGAIGALPASPTLP